MKINCLIIDDEPIARQGLTEYIKEISFLDLTGEASNPVEALKIFNEQNIDLIFLDINMPKMTGLDFLKMNEFKSCTIITSAYDQHAIEAYNLNVIDYLLKPFTFDRFVKAVTKARDKLALQPQKEDDDFFFIKSDSRFIKLHYSQIHYIEAFENYVLIHLADRKIISYVTFGQLEASLPKKQFIKVHRSYIAAISKIESISKEEVQIGNKNIPLSKSLKDLVFKELIEKKIVKR